MGQPFYKKASVQVAMITGIVAILIAAMNIYFIFSDTNNVNLNLKKEIKQKDNEKRRLEIKLDSKEREIQRLETLLTPFRTIALEKYTGTETEALNKLADKIQEYQLTIIEKTRKIEELENTVAKLERMTLPRNLASDKKDILKNLLSFDTNFKIGVVCKAFDTESCNYAEQIRSVFSDAKWQVAPLNKSYLGDIENDIAVNVTNVIQTEIAHKIKDAFNSVDILCDYEKLSKNSISGIKENTIYLIVGSRLKDKS